MAWQGRACGRGVGAGSWAARRGTAAVELRGGSAVVGAWRRAGADEVASAACVGRARRRG